MSILSNLLGHNPQPETKQISGQMRHYNRKQRRHGRFVVKIGTGYVKMTNNNPFTYDLYPEPKQCSVFTYENAQRVLDHTISKNPMVFLVTIENKEITLS